ncbi:MAG TPA: DNA cytosine methyltransferase [Nevskiaceae bacterium]|nr:DNA cytosine methyltransferase [Nevskiaceae bacterium]
MQSRNTRADYRVAHLKVGTAHGAPRVWIEGRRLARAGFSAGQHYAVAVDASRVHLALAQNGNRTVTAKHCNGRPDRPVIDLNGRETLSIFAGDDRVRVVIRRGEIDILPPATRLKARERLDRLITKLLSHQPLSVGSLCHGGGVTSLAIHTGMEAGGVPTRLRFANDVDENVLEQAEQHNPAWTEDTSLVAAPMQEIVADGWLMKHLGRVDLLEAGIPCVAASLAGRAKKHLDMAEADPNAGHLVVPFLGIVEAMQPSVIVVENVPPYQRTASAHLIRNTLRDWGYAVQETILSGADFGALEDRKRMVLVALTAGLHFDLASVVAQPHAVRTLGELLEPVPLDAPCWSTMDYLRTKEVRDAAAGKGFRMQVVGPESTSVGTIGAEYQKNRSTEPKVRHPEQGDKLLRLLTPTEHARIKGVPEALIDGLPATRAHRLLGNGVVFAPFVALGKALATALAATPNYAAREDA